MFASRSAGYSDADESTSPCRRVLARRGADRDRDHRRAAGDPAPGRGGARRGTRGTSPSARATCTRIGMALTMYEGENRGDWPRTVYDPATAARAGQGDRASDAADPFVAGHDRPAERRDRRPVPAHAGRAAAAGAVRLPVQRRDQLRAGLGRSWPAGRTSPTSGRTWRTASPTPTRRPPRPPPGTPLTARLPAAFPIGADKNPGYGQGADDVYGPSPRSPRRLVVEANSPNHEQEGQNVLYADGHVTYERSPLVGLGRRQHLHGPGRSVRPAVERQPDGAGGRGPVADGRLTGEFCSSGSEIDPDCPHLLRRT